jgi:hypothetical protein
MVDDKPEDDALAGDPGRGRRAPPTIDLEATDISSRSEEGGVREAASDAPSEAAGAEQAASEPVAPPTEPERLAGEQPVAPRSSGVSPWVIAPLSGAVAAALVIAVGWMLGWPAVQPPPASPPPQVSTATVDALNGRIAALEGKVSKAPAPVADPATAGRLDGLEKSVSALRGDLAALRTQSDKLGAAVNDIKSAPAPVPPQPDLSAVNERIAQLERTVSSNRSELAQQGEKIADAKPRDDKPLRRVIAATLLDVAVRHGDPYAPQLAAAKSFAPDPDSLKPLDAFASSGIPSAATLCRELVNIVPKLTPPAEAPPAGNSIVDRLQASAAKLVRIERTDGVGTDRGAVVARVTSAALRNDLTEAKRELKSLPDAERESAKAWLDRTEARDAALAASRKLADDAMSDLARPAP